ncbi:MAG: signal recognition particle-docking protein FtsY [Clostridiales Family XIII bacterium]|jgi:fused signal recognition particle receptor|nr:signal recognition particle-docking protein FtsY [Clostridiales Family XIII bacterium]
MVEFEKKQGFFGRLAQRIGDAVLMRPQVDEAFLEELEEILITSDIGMDTSMDIVSKLREAVRMERIDTREGVEAKLQSIIAEIVDKKERLRMTENYPIVVLMVGVNGGGKTTTIAKLAARYKSEGKTVLLAAADTFRAAAADQLEVWAQRAGVPVIRHQEGADPSAVIFDGVSAAKARGVDVLICDTAGRLQNKRGLMAELEKMNRVIAREYAQEQRETLLVLDATTGKNAISQAQEFGQVADVTGIVLTKLDGTAKGGIAITVSGEFDLPVKYIGVGEKLEDLEPFDPQRFAASIFSGVY